MVTKALSPEAVNSIIDDALKLRNFMLDIYALGIFEADVRTEIEKYRPQMTSFMTKHVSLGQHVKIHGDR